MGNTIRKHTSQSGFTIITNSIFMDKSLSLKAKGLLCQLLSLPDSWNFSETGIRKHTSQSGFTIITNSIFMDKSLSLKAKGLLCQLLSLPDSWNFSETGLTKVVSDGRDSIRSAIKELEGAGYLHRERIREKGKMGKMIYHIYETPCWLPSQRKNQRERQNGQDDISHLRNSI